MTLTELSKLLKEDVQYENWIFRHGAMGDGFFVQVIFQARDTLSFTSASAQSGRKWYISTHATPAEIVQTCLKAVLTALEHEAREKFRYKDVAVFQPHLDLDTLVEHAGRKVQRHPAIAANA